MKEKEKILANQRDEIECHQNKHRQMKEELVEREGQLRVIKMNLQTAQKQSVHHAQEVSIKRQEQDHVLGSL